MNKNKSSLIICLIIVLFLLVGILLNVFWNHLDRLTHPQSYAELVTQYAAEYEIDEEIIYAVIKVESNFKPDAESRVGALGLMQMMPHTFAWLTGEEHLNEHLPASSLRDPEVSIRYGIYYLRYLRDKFPQSWDVVLAAYNAGEGNVAEWLSDEEYANSDGTLKDIPFGETKRYVERVNQEKEIYYKLYYKENQ